MEVKRKCIAWRMGMNEDKQNKKKRKEESFEEYKERTTENVQALFSGSSRASHSVLEQSAGADNAPPHNVQSSGTSLSCSRRSPKRQQVHDQLFNTIVGDEIFESYTNSGAQPTLLGMGSIWTRDLHDGARSVIANWFYACAIPHHAAEHPVFQKCFDAALAVGKGFKVPTHYQLSGNLLD